MYREREIASPTITRRARSQWERPELIEFIVGKFFIEIRKLEIKKKKKGTISKQQLNFISASTINILSYFSKSHLLTKYP